MRDRRAFLGGLAASTLAPSLSWAEIGAPAALSAARAPDGSFHLAGLRRDGTLAFTLPLPARGHAAAAHPHRAEAVHIARRPGTFAMVIDCAAGTIRHRLAAPKGRHFYGHGAFTADGTTLLTTENDIETGAGRIGIWAVAEGYRRVGDLPSGGIGPHEIIRLPTGGFAVANGGIRTHPETGREKLNLGTMRPNLAILDAHGALQEVTDSTPHQSSLRHIAAGPDGAVLCGYQWQGDIFDAPPMLAIWRDGQLTEIDLGPAVHRRMKAYVGSVAWGAQGWSASAPRGGVIVTAGAAHAMPDGCGLAALAGETLVTDGLGQVHALRGAGLERRGTHALAFDNHLVSI
ncbi:MAG: DUF1513 domain-containing protein [Pseudomonadota bacterium]